MLLTIYAWHFLQSFPYFCNINDMYVFWLIKRYNFQSLKWPSNNSHSFTSFFTYKSQLDILPIFQQDAKKQQHIFMINYYRCLKSLPWGKYCDIFLCNLLSVTVFLFLNTYIIISDNELCINSVWHVLCIWQKQNL